MRFNSLCLVICALWVYATHALLDESFVSLTAGSGYLDIAGATIVADSKDAAGVHIAVKSLVDDLEQITGISSPYQNYTLNTTLPRVASGIIIGTVDSPLIKSLSARGLLDVSKVAGKWEVFQTTVVEDPFVGVQRALVIAGSDKRGTIFAIHTLAEQSGQSP
jgi:energy-converting hydrogenase Eha subunit C